MYRFYGKMTIYGFCFDTTQMFSWNGFHFGSQQSCYKEVVVYWCYFLLLHANICCGCLTEALLMSTHNMFLCTTNKIIVWLPPIIWGYVNDYVIHVFRTEWHYDRVNSSLSSAHNHKKILHQTIIIVQKVNILKIFFLFPHKKNECCRYALQSPLRQFVQVPIMYLFL